MSNTPLKCYARQDPKTRKVFSTHLVRGTCVFNYNHDQVEDDHPYAGQKIWLTTECEWMAVSDFDGARRTAENVRNTFFVPMDIDVPCHLSDVQIMEFENGFPRGKKIRTSFGENGKIKMHVLYELECPSTPELQALFKVVQVGLSNMFAASNIEVDKSIIGDLTRFVRNPYGIGRKNLKYDDQPEVVVLDDGEPTSLGNMYKILKGLGFLPEQKHVRKTSPFKNSFNIVRTYFRKNRLVECTQAELAERLGIPLRTLQFILKRLKGTFVDIKWVGNNRGDNKRRCVFLSLISEPQQKEIKANTTVARPSPSSIEPKLLDYYKKKTIKIGERNKFVFAATLELVHLFNFKRNPDRIFDYLRDTYKIDGLGTTFSEREMRECILSALNPHYTHPINPAKLRSDIWGLLPKVNSEPYLPKVNPLSDTKPNYKLAAILLLNEKKYKETLDMIKLSLLEQETVVSFNRKEDFAEVSTNVETIKRLMRKRGVEPIGDTQAGYSHYRVPKSWIKISPPRIVSEKQKELARQRMCRFNSEQKKYSSSKQKNT